MPDDTSAPDVVLTRDHQIATVKISQPGRRNAINAAMWQRLEHAMNEIASDPQIRVLVLTGAGVDFCSGADLRKSDDLAGASPAEHPLAMMHRVNRAVLALHRLPVPVIARVDGVAVGAGCNLALGCDLIIASDRARFSEIFAARALSVDAGGSWLLPRLIGLHRAKELCLLADVLSAADAQEIGLVNRVVPVESLDKAVAELAERLARSAPVALRLIKRLLNEGSGSSFEQALEAEAAAQSVNLQGADTAEAFAAFTQKRTATFTGDAYRI